LEGLGSILRRYYGVLRANASLKVLEDRYEGQLEFPSGKPMLLRYLYCGSLQYVNVIDHSALNIGIHSAFNIGIHSAPRLMPLLKSTRRPIRRPIRVSKRKTHATRTVVAYSM
jgi:hypothetical protein